jgi:hypothetical protein
MRRLGSIIFAVALSGCPFGGVNQLNRLPESQPLREPQLVNRPGVLTHDPTRFSFPEWYDNFQRVTAYRYDTGGLDFSVGYNDRRPDCLIVATFYIYPAPRMTFIGASPSVVSSLQQSWLRNEFARSKQEIDAAHPGLRDASVRDRLAPIGDSLVEGPSYEFSEAEDVSEMRLFLYDRQWFLKYRFTYPQSCEADALTRLAALARKLPWSAAASG